MRKKLLTTYIAIIAITIGVTILVSWHRINERFFIQIENETNKQAELLVDILNRELKSSNTSENSNDIILQEFAQYYGQKADLRITIIDTMGEVIADSLGRANEMENHKYRLEIKSALNGKVGSAIRYSDTMGINYFYYAMPLEMDEFQGALRLSLPINSIKELQWEWVRVIVVAIISGVILSLCAAYLFTRKFVKPIEELTKTAKQITEGDLEKKVYVDNVDEIGELAKAFNIMTNNLRENLLSIEHKNAEMESILTSIDFGLVAIDLSYKVIFHNEPFKNILNIKEDLEGKYFYESLRNTAMINVIEKSIDYEEFIDDETVIRIGSEERIVKFSASPIKSYMVDEDLLGMLIVVEDVTQIRKLETVRQEFVSNVTHELKTPLTSIRGFVDTLKNGAIHDESVATRFLDIIEIESERLTLLIEDILVLSEIESLNMDRNMSEYSMEKIINEAVDVLEVKANEKNLEIKVEIEKDMKPFYCSNNRVKQLLINLIDNSLKYTVTGYISISCWTTDDDSNIIIKVIDTGIGMGEEHLDRLFERFYRVDKGRARKMGGTGLGLSIVKHIVELYNGKIEIESELGKGTSITVILPYR